jgi:hypothetical protein
MEDKNMIDDRKYPIVMFGNEMFKELEKHHTEKELKFYEMSIEKLFKLLYEQANDRLTNIEKTIFREDTPLIDIEKNCVHMANYFYFLWSQARRMREKKS